MLNLVAVLSFFKEISLKKTITVGGGGGVSIVMTYIIQSFQMFFVSSFVPILSP